MQKLSRGASQLIAGITTAALLLGGIAPSHSCCSLAPAHFSQTKGYAGQGHKDGKLVHVLAYQNTTVNKNTAAGGNAMFLPIPAVRGSMTEQNIVNTSKFPDFLDDMGAAIPPSAGPMDMSSARPEGISRAPIVFNSDIYTIVLAQDANAIAAALTRVPANKRPNMNKEIFAAYAKWYPGWTFALCCFNNKDAARAKPMLWWYQPLDKETLFFPALDAHDGNAPVIKSQVAVDHTLFFSAENLPADTVMYKVNYTNFSGGKPPISLQGLLPQQIIGRELLGSMPQGDFSLKISELKNNPAFSVDRILPPGVPVSEK